MPFDWSQYLVLATELGARPDEASIRTALSRAYYYVYHIALIRAQSNDFVLKLDDFTHAQLWLLFSESPEPACQRLAAIANRMKERRVRADYKSTFPRIAEEVPGTLADAQTFVAGLQRLPARHPQPLRDRRW